MMTVGVMQPVAIGRAGAMRGVMMGVGVGHSERLVAASIDRVTPDIGKVAINRHVAFHWQE